MLGHLALLKGITDSKQRKETVEALLHRTNLYEHRKKALSGFSGGMRQRFGIAQALLGNPRLLIVDEPTAGLDPGERNRFYSLLSEIGEDVIVILSTHIVEDVMELCTNMAIIHEGKVLFAGAPSEAVKALEGRIWQKSVAKAEVKDYEQRYRVISSKLIAGKPLIHIYSAENPGDGFTPVSADLEDVFFSRISGIAVRPAMFKQFFTFEVRFWLRSWMLWVFFLIVALMFFGAASSDQITVGSSLKNTYRNAPWVVENFYAICSLLTLLMTTAFVNSAASRDFAHNTHQILFSTPIRKLDYLGGRFLGSALIAVIPLLGVSVGILAAKYMPWVDAERWGPVVWAAHWKAILVFAVPNTLFIAAVIFAIAVLTRSTVVSFLGSLALLAGYGISQVFTSDLKNQKLAALIDPFGIDPFLYATKYWTVAEKNTLSVGYSGYLLWNRLIWLGVGAAIFAFAYWRFSFAERSPRKKKLKAQESVSITSTAIPVAARNFGVGAEWSQFWGTVKIEFKRLVKTTSFIVITAFALLNCVPALIYSNTEGFGNTFLPVTYRSAGGDCGHALPVSDRHDHLFCGSSGVGGARQRD